MQVPVPVRSVRRLLLVRLLLLRSLLCPTDTRQFSLRQWNSLLQSARRNGRNHHAVDPEHVRVCNVMSPQVFWLSADDSVRSAAGLLRRQRIEEPHDIGFVDEEPVVLRGEEFSEVEGVVDVSSLPSSATPSARRSVIMRESW